MVQIDFLSNKLFFGPKTFFWFKNSFFGPKTIHGQKDIFCKNIFSIHLVQKEFGPQNILSKPDPNSNSMQLGLGLDIVVTANPPHSTPPQTFQPLLDMLGS